MNARLDVGKVVVGAFLVPWWNRKAFVRALAIPLVLLVILSIFWRYLGKQELELANALIYVVSVALSVLFAVTCHRLVLLDSPPLVAKRAIPRWSWRETRFFLFMVAVGFIATVGMLSAMTFLLNVWTPVAAKRDSAWFDGIKFVAEIPAFYLFARLCLIFPATAIDRRVDLKWAWRLTERNGWRLVVVVAVLPWVISYLVGLLYRGDPSIFETVALTFVGYTLFAVEIAALSLSYRELTKEETPVSG